MVRGETVQSVRDFPTFLCNVSIFLPDCRMSQQKKSLVFLFAAVTISNLALLLQIFENDFLPYIGFIPPACLSVTKQNNISYL